MIARRALAVLVVTGAMGFALGALFRAGWHDAIEPAQVLAGVVSYRPDNPVYLYSVGTWTLLHQIPALLIRAGLSDLIVTRLLSGVLGMVSFQALGMTVYALAGDALLAMLVPGFLYATHATAGGVTYPIALLGVDATYGVVGLSFTLLVIACAGAGEFRIAALLLGLLPAVHLTIAGWAWAIVGLAIALDASYQGPEWRRAWRWGATGCAVSAASAAIHFVRYPPMPAAGAAAAGDLSVGVLLQHNHHLFPFAPLSALTFPAIVSVGFGAIWVWRFRDLVPRPSLMILRAVVIAGLLGSTLAAWRFLLPATLPDVIWVLMPPRLLNLPILAGMAVLIGVAGRYRYHPACQILLVVLVVILGGGGLFTAYLPEILNASMLIAAGWLLAVAPVLARGAIAAARSRRGVATTARVLTAACLVALLLQHGEHTLNRMVYTVPDRATNSFLATVAARPGLLLTDGYIHLAQAKTRRPLLVDRAAIDGLMYTPAAARAADPILRDVFGFGLMEPGNDAAENARWAARTPAEWRAIRDRYGVTDVLTSVELTLQLPVVARDNAEGILYEIP